MVTPDYGLLSGILQNPEFIPPNGLSVLTASRPTPWFGEFPFPPSPAMIFLILAASWRALTFRYNSYPGSVYKQFQQKYWKVRVLMVPVVIQINRFITSTFNPPCNGGSVI